MALQSLILGYTEFIQNTTLGFEYRKKSPTYMLNAGKIAQNELMINWK